MPTREIDGHQIDLSNLDKPFFPEADLTKGDLIDYYEKVAETMLPHLAGRPLTMQRFPDGVEAGGFYHKQLPDYFPDWVTSVEVDTEDGSQRQVICDSEATLVYLANQACITPHVWLSRAEALDRPDLLVVDLDPPGEDGGFDALRDAARWVRDGLEEVGLTVYLKTTGSRGLHLCVPLDGEADFDESRSFAQDLMKHLADEHDDALTTAQRKAKRGDRIFLDVGRNAYGQTAVAPYAVRARPTAPIATPIRWDELGDSDLGPRTYTIKNIFRRLAQVDDPWAQMHAEAGSLASASARLERRSSD